MPVPFYMLIRTKMGYSREVVHETLKIKGVKISHSVMGNYEIILYAEGENIEDVRRIRNTVHEINGVTLTETCIHA
jgi:hypothetical protein